MARPSIRRSWRLLAAAVAVVLLVAWAMARLRGPTLPGYEIVAGPLVQDVVATGRVAAPSRVEVGAEIAGLVLERRVMEGDRVAPGDVLVVLRARELEARRDEARAALAAVRLADRPEAQARLREASAALAQAQRDYARRRELGEQQLVSRQSVEQAAQAVVAARAAAEQARVAADAVTGGARELQASERLAAAQAELDRSVVRATVAGTVLARHVEPGDNVTPGKLLLEISRDAPGEILVPLDEKHLAHVRVGQPATCIADAYPDRPFDATVFHVAPSVDPARGTVDVRLRIDPKATFVRQDMTATATIHTGRRDEALVVPNDALLDASNASDRASVLRVRNGRVQHVEVTLGLRGLAASEVVEGLEAGDQVVATGALDPAELPEDGARVRIEGQPLPDPAEANADTRGELPIQLD